MKKKYSTNKTLTEKQRALLAENTKLVGAFIKKYWPAKHISSALREELYAEGNKILCERIHSYRPSKGEYSTWAYRVLYFCLRNVYNKQRYNESMFVDFASNDDKEENGVPKWAKNEEHSETLFGLHESEFYLEQKIVKEHFNKLTPLEQKVVSMFMNNCSAKEISKECKIPSNKAYYIKNMAINKLRKMLKIKSK